MLERSVRAHGLVQVLGFVIVGMGLEQSTAPPVVNRRRVDSQLVGDLVLGQHPGFPEASQTGSGGDTGIGSGR